MSQSHARRSPGHTDLSAPSHHRHLSSQPKFVNSFLRTRFYCVSVFLRFLENQFRSNGIASTRLPSNGHTPPAFGEGKDCGCLGVPFFLIPSFNCREDESTTFRWSFSQTDS